MQNKSYDVLIKLLLIGDSGVGKTCLLLRYVDEGYSDTFISTIGIDFKIKTTTVNGKRVKLQIWDTAGQERFQQITASYYRGAMGILLVYDVAQPKTFNNIQSWMRNLDKDAAEDVEKLIVANKCDLTDRRKIDTETGQSMADKYKVGFIETSAKQNTNVDQAFELLIKPILAKTKDRMEPRPSYPDLGSTQNAQSSSLSSCCGGGGSR